MGMLLYGRKVHAAYKMEEEHLYEHSFHGLLDGEFKMPKEFNNLFWLLICPK